MSFFMFHVFNNKRLDVGAVGVFDSVLKLILNHQESRTLENHNIAP
jgi:hypothetical protein